MHIKAAAGVVGLTLALASVGLAARQAAKPASPVVAVYKSATCGCCAKWVDHMRAAGFTVKVTDVSDVETVKDQYKVPEQTRSCHTSVVDGYVFEGHVPADLVQKVLRERPTNIVGIAVPGMPAGSPGMEVPGGQKDSYKVVAFDKQGKQTVYATR